MFKPDNKKSAPSSLRSRYIILTILLGLIVISTVLFFYSGVLTNKRELTNKVENINQKRNKLELIHRNLFKIHRNVGFFLNDPLQGKYTEISQQLIADSIKTAMNLTQVLGVNHQNEATRTVKLLDNNLNKLQKNVSTLFKIRMDINQQYPGLALSANEMTPPLHAVDGNFELLRNEIENKEFKPSSDTLFPSLMDSYLLWASQVSQVRIYFANRLASFSNQILSDQVESYYHIHNKFSLSINKLEKLYANEDSFEGESLVASIKKNSEKWHQIFIQVQLLTELESWRGDVYYQKTQLNPLIDKITDLIISMDGYFLAEQKNIIKELRNNTETLTTLIIFIIILFLLFISAIIWSLDWMVFKPINQVVMALKSTAFERDAPKILAVNSREISSLVEAFSEMNEQVSHRQNALEHQALHDYLTGLPNRLMLNERLEYQILQSERDKQNFSLFLIDLDHFKDVNDSLGHLMGDILLENVAKRLTEQVRKVDTIARLGGDEFAIILPDTNKEQSESLATKINISITKLFNIDNQIINIGLSIGIVNFPEDGTDKISLLKHADIAMYLSKKNRTCFSHYDSDEDIYSRNRLVLINDLRDAIANDTLDLYYQPQIDVQSEQIIGAEALLRWNHPEHGFIQPDKIVELAEYEGIIHQLSLWVLKQAIAECSLWHQEKHQLSISVNLSVHDLLNHSLNEQVAALIEQYQLKSQFLTLEVTESGMMNNPARSIEMLEKLNNMGIKLSIDDFGTGFSSLAYLKKLPVHELKIDQSFIFNMDNDESDVVIVKSTIDLGHNLGLRVTAEGVENSRILDIIKNFGCDYAQGYLFSRPKPRREFLSMLNEEC